MAQQKPVVKKTTKPKLGGEIGRPPFDKNSPVTYLPGRKATNVPAPKKPKAKNGTSLGMKSVKAGFDKNPGVTRADIITAATKKAKNGKPIKKAFLGAIAPLAMKALPMLGGMLGGKGKGGGGGGLGGMLGGLLGKNGKTVKRAKSGTLVKKAQMGSFVTNEFAAKNRAFPASPKPKSTSNTKLLDSSIKKGKAINAYQGKKGMVAKSGTSMKKCKGGC
jgi:hypothetical protein